MNVIKTGNIWSICGDNIETSTQLPALTYKVCFTKNRGFFLQEHPNLEIKEEKLYGAHLSKTDKVMRSFKLFSRSLGVILSGDKGIGKSLVARLICLKAQEQGMPIILATEDIPGLADYIAAIDQEVVVLFDEFEKVFSDDHGDNNGNESSQTALLSLFDGVAAGKKLYIVTCNELEELNSYLLNRPGRFHYHFRFKYPTQDEVREYLVDNLNPKYAAEIENVVKFSGKLGLNYDCLRAIAFELNGGEPFESAIGDLNIINMGYRNCALELKFSNGLEIRRDINIDFFDDEECTIDVRDDTGNKTRFYTLTYRPIEGVYLEGVKGVAYDVSMVKVEYNGRSDEYKDGTQSHTLPKLTSMVVRQQTKLSTNYFS